MGFCSCGNSTMIQISPTVWKCPRCGKTYVKNMGEWIRFSMYDKLEGPG